MGANSAGVIGGGGGRAGGGVVVVVAADVLVTSGCWVGWPQDVSATSTSAAAQTRITPLSVEADIDAVMFEVVQGVRGERLHGERRAIAAQSATVPLVVLYRAVGERKFCCSGG